MKPPYYAVIFTSLLNVTEGYGEIAEQMMRLAQKQKGYLGMDTARYALGITVSYWENEAAISQWKQQVDHLAAQQLGKEKWYASYRVRVAKVERDYGFESE